MGVYKHGNLWWLDCKLRGGKRVRQSLKTADRAIAEVRAQAIKDGLALDRPAPPFDLNKRLCQIRARAAKNGWEFNLTADDLAELISNSGGHCALTGIKFRPDRRDDWTKAPFAPTVDRIDRSRGYVKKNCRIVCHAANVALNEWGEEVFEEVAARYLALRSVSQNPPQNE